MISYSQQTVSKVTMHINTQGVKLEDTSVNGLSAKYYSNQGVQTLIWYDDYYVYILSSALDSTAVFRIAESIPIGRK